MTGKLTRGRAGDVQPLGEPVARQTAREGPNGADRPEDCLPRVLCAAGLNPGLKFGSLEEQLLLLARAFRQQGSTFVPLFDSPLRGRTLAAYESEGLASEWLDLHTYRLGTLRRLLRVIDEHAIQIVHWSFYHPLNAYVWSLTVARPFLTHYLTDHNSRPASLSSRRRRAPRALKGVLLKRYHRIVCVSEFVADSLRREGLAEQLTTCAHFVNTERFGPDAAVREQVRGELRADSEFVLLLVAHLIPEKGGEVLLRALPELPPRIQAWIVGDGPDADRLRGLAEELGLSKQVRFLGNQDEVQRYMQAADCLICPSLWQEAAGLVNIEALACGLPVVASRIGGIPEIVEHGRTGFLFESGRSDQLAAALRNLLDEPELREEMGRAARAVALERYSAERRIPEYLDLYRSMDPEQHHVQ